MHANVVVVVFMRACTVPNVDSSFSSVRIVIHMAPSDVSFLSPVHAIKQTHPANSTSRDFSVISYVCDIS